MKIFKIVLSIIIGLAILVGIITIISLNHKVKDLDSLNKELKTRVPVENDLTDTDDDIFCDSTCSEIPVEDEDDSISVEAPIAENPRNHHDDFFFIRNTILSELRHIDCNRDAYVIAREAREIVQKYINNPKIDKTAGSWFERYILKEEDDAIVRGIVRKLSKGWDPFHS